MLIDDNRLLRSTNNGLDDSDRVQGNDTHFVLKWRGSSDVSKLRGRRVKLLLESRSAKLFAVHPEFHGGY